MLFDEKEPPLRMNGREDSTILEDYGYIYLLFHALILDASIGFLPFMQERFAITYVEKI